MKQLTVIEGVTIVGTFVLGVGMIFAAGVSAGNHEFVGAMIDFVLGLFQFSLCGAVIHTALKFADNKLQVALDEAPREVARQVADGVTRDLRMYLDAQKEAAKNMVAPGPDPQAGESQAKTDNIRSELKQLLEHAMPVIKQYMLETKLDEMLGAIIEDTGGYPLTEDRIPQVEDRFHEETDDWYVDIELENDGENINIEYSKEPFSVRVKEPAAKPVRKPRTRKAHSKSEERRLEAMKREKRNQQRRERRAAAKAAETAEKEE